ncbi:MAG TPA: hypothetical protein EYH32_08295, partial [Anaerolineae bacterium]|nr:hypothetical protein [Anaerolineae bacterium]
MPERHITTGPVPTAWGDIVARQTPPPAPPEEPAPALSRVEGPPAFRVLTIVARPLNQTALPEIGDAWSLA